MQAGESTYHFYEINARDYATASGVAPGLRDFMAEAPRGARVLDLGCGAGHDSAALRDAGFVVTSLDRSPALAAEAKRAFGIDVLVADFRTLAYREEFDGVWASASLHHLPGDALPEVLQRIRTALTPGGILHATLKAAPNDRRDTYGRFFCAMDEARLISLTTEWAASTIDRGHGTGLGGEPTDWLLLRARR